MSGVLRGPTRERNRLLAAPPPYEYARLAPYLDEVRLHPKQLLGIPDEPLTLVYLPRSAVVSLLVPMEDGSAVEAATVGNEGLIGLDAILGDNVTRAESVVYVPGLAAAVDATILRD